MSKYLGEKVKQHEHKARVCKAPSGVNPTSQIERISRAKFGQEALLHCSALVLVSVKVHNWLRGENTSHHAKIPLPGLVKIDCLANLLNLFYKCGLQKRFNFDHIIFCLFEGHS